jgi:hypothetical protein
MAKIKGGWEMIKAVVVAVVVFVLGLSLNLLAETVGSPASCGFPAGPGLVTKDALIEKGLRPIYITGLTEFVFKKELDSGVTSNLEIKGQWYLSKISLAVKDNFQPFVLLGSSALDLSGDMGTTKIKSDGDGSFAYGGGVSWVFYKIPTYDVALTLTGFYRESKLDGKMIKPVSNVSNLDTKIDELVVALTASKDMVICKIPVRPYLSVIYDDSDVHFRFNTNSGTVAYDLGVIDNNRNVGLALGCEKEFLKGLALNTEVRFFTELGATVGLTAKF